MDRKYFLELDNHLRTEISRGLKLDENSVFIPIMQQIAFSSCLILGMRSVAYRTKLSEPYRDERDEYFKCIESILEIFYTGFSKIPFEEKIKVFHKASFTPQTNKEQFEAIKKIEKLLPGLKTSWIEMC